MNKKQVIRLTERQFNQIVKSATKKVLREQNEDGYSNFDYQLYHLYELASNYMTGDDTYSADEIIEEVSGCLGEHFA